MELNAAVRLRTLVAADVSEADVKAAVKTVVRELKLPSAGLQVTTWKGKTTIYWSKRGGYAGENVIQRVRAAAQAAKWKDGPLSSGAHPDGSWVSNSEVFHKGLAELSLRVSWGSTKDSNDFSVTVVLAHPESYEGTKMKINAATRLRASAGPQLGTLIQKAFEREYDQDVEVLYAREVSKDAKGNSVILFSSKDVEENQYLVNRIVLTKTGKFVDMDSMPEEECVSAAAAKKYIDRA